MTIYTKTGDDGTTSLFGGKRVLKSDPQVEAYGSVDELTSFLGLVIVKVKDKNQASFLLGIQRDLYKIMGYLAGAKEDMEPLENKVNKIEQLIDNVSPELPELKRFILPGGTELSAWFHVLRTVCRRAERAVVFYKNSEIIIKYLNRLSDLFFVLSRFYNQKQEAVA